MEFKQFSHTHNLIFQQLPQGTEIRCSGCNNQGQGSVYVCWPCNFYLHEQCFKASRSMIHPSHPSHPLCLVPYPTYPSSSFFCNSCNQLGTGFSYTCANCEFDLHVQCAIATQSQVYSPYPNQSIQIEKPSLNPQAPTMPHNTTTEPIQITLRPNLSQNNVTASGINSLISALGGGVALAAASQANQPTHPLQTVEVQKQPPGTKHFSHNHALYLSRVQEKDPKFCSGCEKDLVGWAYICKESQCSFYLHQSCFKLPQEIRHNSHLEHPLTLLPTPPYEEDNEFTCNACLQNGRAFTYNCLVCNFDIHVDCASLPDFMVREDHEHPLVLFYSSINTEGAQGEQQNFSFTCNVCQQSVHELCWAYYCQKCKFGTHLECVNSKEWPVDSKSQEDEVHDAQVQLERLQLLMKLRRQNDQFILDLI